MQAVRLALLSLACLLPLAASAEWQWLDKDGHRVFSDQPPPSDVAPDRILKKPGTRNAAAKEEAAPVAAAAPSGVDPALKPSGKDKALEERRKQVQAAEADKKKAEEARVAALRADNCSRARSAKAQLQSGDRIAIQNDQGERDYMDDNRRASEIQRLEGIIGRECRAADRQ